jgi:hypothetical protein
MTARYNIEPFIGQGAGCERSQFMLGIDQYSQLVFDILLVFAMGFIFLRLRKIDRQLRRLSRSAVKFEQLAERLMLISVKQSESAFLVPEGAETDQSLMWSGP